MRYEIKMSWDGEAWSEPLAVTDNLDTAELIRLALIADDDEYHLFEVFER